MFRWCCHAAIAILSKVWRRDAHGLTVPPIFCNSFWPLSRDDQEIRNLVWISECIVQQQRDEIGKYIPLFSDNAPWKVARRAQR